MTTGTWQQPMGNSKKVKVIGIALSAMLFVICSVGQAQQPAKIARIGYVSGSGSGSDQGPYVEALRQGLRDLVISREKTS